MNKKLLVFYRNTADSYMLYSFIKITCEGVSKGKTLVSVVDKDGIGREKNTYENTGGTYSIEPFDGVDKLPFDHTLKKVTGENEKGRY